MSVHVFVEGGGSQKKTQTECRKAFHLLFEKVLADKRRPASPRVAAAMRPTKTSAGHCSTIKMSSPYFSLTPKVQ